MNNIYLDFRMEVGDRVKKFGLGADLNDMDLTNVTSLDNIFSDPVMQGFHGDISKWDVSKITNMSFVFMRADVNVDISKWDVSNVKSMSHMFWRAKFTGDISSWNISNVTNMSHMFSNSNINQENILWGLPSSKWKSLFKNIG